MHVAEDEIELKFLCEPADLAAILDGAPEGETEQRRLVATYFDTPDGALRDQRISLRIRESGGEHIQTLKRGDGFAREEHEVPVKGGSLDLSMPALKAALPTAARRKTLAPAFTVRVVRRQRTFDYQDARIEIAVDEGEVHAGDRSRPVSEVELELKSGGCEPMFDLARALSKIAPLYLSFDGKATQGRGLADGAERSPRRHDKAPLARGLTTAQAFQAIARNALVQIAANGVVLREADGVEAVHQLRVAVRRLRSAISTFKSVVGGEQAEAIKTELKWLARACDEARDLDVFALDNDAFAQPGLDLAALVPLVEAARQRGHAKACAAVASGRFRDLVLETTAWVETGAWLVAPGKDARRARDKPVRDFAAKALTRRRKTLMKLGRDLDQISDVERHDVRIAAKKLRYAAEAFAPLFDVETKPFIKGLKALQGHLGALNDGVVAAELVERLKFKGPALAAAKRLLAVREAQKPKALKASAKSFDDLAKVAVFW